ncbi:MAG: DUF269 domain-containing protein [Cyanobacteria bacterium P01_G01_bin.39]
MNQALLLETSLQLDKIKHPFLQELIKQIRLADTLCKYRDCKDELLLDQLLVSLDKEEHSSKNLNFDPLNQIITNAFYNAIGSIIEQRARHPTETYVHLRNKEFSSAVIFCGGVLVSYSLIWGYQSFGFLSLEELIESAETNIKNALTKANRYLDF